MPRPGTRSFNPRTHAGCDWRRDICPRFAGRVSIHAPTRGATSFGATKIDSHTCFNPRTHAGCDTYTASPTPEISSFNPRTHAGCDIGYGSLITIRASFNPRTHAGCDLRPPRSYRPAHGVSIHAPTRGATHTEPGKKFRRSRFNPRTHAGCDIGYGSLITIRPVSIHAPTRGATLLASPLLWRSGSFNPRTHAGCDNAIASLVPLTAVSIHAPTRGATKIFEICSAVLSEFQSTHPRGVRRPRLLKHQQVTICFNPRTHAGCDIA